MSIVLLKLARDHSNVATLLGLLESEITNVHTGEIADFDLMRDIMAYMTQYPDRVHHPMEDLMFARWLDRDESARELVESLEREHRGLVQKSEALAGVLAQVVEGAMVSREEIEARARDYVDFLRHHMKVEDERAFPGAERALREEDWTAIADEYAGHEDPIFGPVVHKEFRDLFLLVTRDARPSDAGADRG